MSVKPLFQNEPFVFSQENQEKIEKLLARYPKDRKVSAILPVLDLAQRQCGGWLPREAMEAVAELLGVTPLYVWEIATFYTMFHLRPTGQHHVQVCRTASCYLRGAGKLTKVCEKKLKIACGQTREDGKFSLEEVECLGACVNAPVVQINDDYYEDLSPEALEDVLEALETDESVKPGSQTRQKLSTAPAGYGAKPEKKGGRRA